MQGQGAPSASPRRAARAGCAVPASVGRSLGAGAPGAGTAARPAAAREALGGGGRGRALPAVPPGPEPEVRARLAGSPGGAPQAVFGPRIAAARLHRYPAALAPESPSPRQLGLAPRSGARPL
ncbi:PREDICTED: translation initiation factor IF-2-like [Chinchilla lanigera]|uniref:translation initiation factor IF-2-like n=1 Tax=Chinchilla lanigera TaxID=34839 RepID=UPI000699095B|nr:PREDICTED: translation initiation factor IF-2-like [Chinchilla lanigera]